MTEAPHPACLWRVRESALSAGRGDWITCHGRACPGHPVSNALCLPKRDARDKRAHDELGRLGDVTWRGVADATVPIAL